MEVKEEDLQKRKNLKRKKRSNLFIEGQKYSFYEITWEDIVGDSSLGSYDDFCKMKTAIVTSFAYIFKQDQNYLYTFASYSGDQYFGDRNIIPLGVVKSIKKIGL